MYVYIRKQYAYTHAHTCVQMKLRLSPRSGPTHNTKSEDKVPKLSIQIVTTAPTSARVSACLMYVCCKCLMYVCCKCLMYVCCTCLMYVSCTCFMYVSCTCVHV